MAGEEIERLADDAANRGLQRLGFHKQAPGIYELEFAAGLPRGWLGVNRGIHADHVQLFPHVGIRDPLVSALRRRLMGGKTEDHVATVGVNISIADPHLPTYWTMRAGEVEPTIEEVVTAVATVGIPFMLRLARDPQAVDGLIASHHPQKEFMLPLHRLSYGHSGEALEYALQVARRYAESPAPDGSFQAAYREFVERIRQECEGR